MARPSPPDRTVRRPGVVLLVVMAMLALFAVVGLSFVFYAESEAESARFRRQAETLDLADVTPEKLFSYALGQLIFDTDNPKSKMHGHSLGRSMYGSPGGTVPFSGLGRPHPDTEQTLEGLTPFDGINVPYTYPDINNPFLACLDPDKPGYLKERSFFRNGSSLRPGSLTPLLKKEGDVRNIDSLDGTISPTRPDLKLYNDAFWMDLDFPIMTAKDGTRYKPLFAFTVLDLDGRLNLAVSGNYKADYTKTGGTSRCGLGTFEINPARVLTIDKSEIAKLFQGTGTAPNRYGADNVPDNGIRFPLTLLTPLWNNARVDYTGMSGDTVARAAVPYSHFPTYGAWADIAGSLNLTESAQHAVGFDYFGSRSPASPASDIKMAASNAEAILRWRDRGAPALTSDLIRLLPNNLNTQVPASAPIFNMITPYSMSLDTAHLAPFFTGDANTKFLWNAGDLHPKSTTVTQPLPQSLLTGAGEFGPDFRSQVAALLPRFNINRSAGLFDLYQSAPMVQEVFDRLVRATGALPPSQAPPFQPANPNDPQYKATRWLAQLAANIVDFIDEGDDMVMFRWNPSPNPTEVDFVFGVEMNQAVIINEAYASVDNDPADIKGAGATKYRVNAWAELYSPSLTAGNRKVDLQVNFLTRSRYIYRLLLAEDTEGIADSPRGLPKNLLYAKNDPNLGVMNWKSNKELTTLSPGDKQASGPSFLLIGPPDEFIAERKPSWTDANGKALAWNHPPAGMTSSLRDLPPDYNSLSNRKVTLVLQRVAISTREESNDTSDPFKYNPYVTVDVFPDIPVYNSVQYIGTTDFMPPKLGQFRSVGRYQPLQATDVKMQSPIPSKPDQGNEPQHTFGRQNARDLKVPVPGDKTNTLKVPFDTIYPLDRAFVSTAEALLAPAVRPWELTQRFGTQQPYSAFSVCQNDVNSLLFRFLETVTTGDRSYNAHLAPTYRPTTFNLTGFAGSGLHALLVPGKINLNTVSDERIIEALFDRQSNSIFTDDDVHQFWLDLLIIRKTRPIAGFSDYTLDRNTRAVTMHNTLIGNLFKKMHDRAARDGANEYEATEGMRKVMNNITFTSNAFAVWVTAGFFEVDAAGNPMQELGKNENRHVRHRMFAIVDRSQLVLPLPPQRQPFTVLTDASAAKGATTIALAATTGTLKSSDPAVKVDFAWQIKAGTVLTLDRGLDTEETVVVQRVNGNQIQIGDNGFRHPHKGGAYVDLGGIQGAPAPVREMISYQEGEFVDLSGVQGAQVPLNRAPNGTTVPNFMLGYPGPQPQFNLREYTYVVPYYNIID